MFLVHHASDGPYARGSLLILMYCRTLPSTTPKLSEFSYPKLSKKSVKCFYSMSLQTSYGKRSRLLLWLFRAPHMEN